MADQKRTTVAVKISRGLDQTNLRTRIIQEHRLRQEVTREEELRRESPDVWRWKEAIRLEGKRADEALNHQLRAAGCQPVGAALSLNQKMKKLQQLEARNRAEIASLRKRS